MKKTRKILICIAAFILLLNIINTAGCSSQKANQDIDPIEIVKSVISSLELNPDDIGDQYYSEGDEDHVFDDILLKIMFPPSPSADGDIIYTMDLFDHYAIIQYEGYKPVIFEMAVFKVSRSSHENDTVYRNTVKKIENMCKERLVKVKKEIFEYKPDLAYIADNSNVYILDNYVYYIISENSSAAYETVKSELTAYQR